MHIYKLNEELISINHREHRSQYLIVYSNTSIKIGMHHKFSPCNDTGKKNCTIASKDAHPTRSHLHPTLPHRQIQPTKLCYPPESHLQGKIAKQIEKPKEREERSETPTKPYKINAKTSKFYHKRDH